MIITNHAFLPIGADDLKCQEPILSSLEQLSCTSIKKSSDSCFTCPQLAQGGVRLELLEYMKSWGGTWWMSVGYNHRPSVGGAGRGRLTWLVVGSPRGRRVTGCFRSGKGRVGSESCFMPKVVGGEKTG